MTAEAARPQAAAPDSTAILKDCLSGKLADAYDDWRRWLAAERRASLEWLRQLPAPSVDGPAFGERGLTCAAERHDDPMRRERAVESRGLRCDCHIRGPRHTGNRAIRIQGMEVVAATLGQLGVQSEGPNACSAKVDGSSVGAR